VNDIAQKRFQPPLPAAFDDHQRNFYQRLLGGPRGTAGNVPLIAEDGSLLGPFAAMAIAPDVGDAVAQVGEAVRYRTRLDSSVREAAVLMVAAHYRSAFEWSAHEAPAREAGLRDDQLDQLADKTVPSGLNRGQTLALRAVHTMLMTGTMDESTYGETVRERGERDLAELVWLTGYYSMLALALSVFDLNVSGEDRAG
jgi:alkylhydroperoxidase family enzyme